jgi:hypothetical protein
VIAVTGPPTVSVVVLVLAKNSGTPTVEVDGVEDIPVIIHDGDNWHPRLPFLTGAPWLEQSTRQELREFR